MSEANILLILITLLHYMFIFVESLSMVENKVTCISACTLSTMRTLFRPFNWFQSVRF